MKPCEAFRTKELSPSTECVHQSTEQWKVQCKRRGKPQGNPPKSWHQSTGVIATRVLKLKFYSKKSRFRSCIRSGDLLCIHIRLWPYLHDAPPVDRVLPHNRVGVGDGRVIVGHQRHHHPRSTTVANKL